MVVNGTNGLPGNSMFTAIFDSLPARSPLQWKNSLFEVVTLNSKCRRPGPRGRAVEHRFDSPRFVRKYGDVVLVVGNRKNFLSVIPLSDFGAHKERHTVARIRQGNGDV